MQSYNQLIRFSRQEEVLVREVTSQKKEMRIRRLEAEKNEEDLGMACEASSMLRLRSRMQGEAIDFCMESLSISINGF